MAPLARIAPFNEAAMPGLATWETYLGPTKGFDEAVYACELLAAPDGKTLAALANRSGTLGVVLRYDVGQLPAFTLWKNTDTERQGYVTGLEPGTNYPYPRAVEQRLDRLRRLQPGASQEFRIDIDFLSTAEAVAGAAAEIATVAAGVVPTVEAEPVFLAP
jgi:hypothetical protein